ncbi:MAG: glycosyltransferase family 4 protein [Vicinamibacterales bacterium]
MLTENRERRRIAMLAHTCYLRDPRVRREAEALVEAGHEVHIVSLSETNSAGVKEPRRATFKGVHVRRLPVARRRGSLARYAYEYLATLLLGALELTLMHLRKRLDVVHVHNMPDLLVLAGILPRLMGARLVLDVHDPMPELFMSWGKTNKLLIKLLRIQERFSWTIADRVVSVNESMRDHLQAKGVPAEKIFIVNNFPDQRLFPLCEPSTWPRNGESLVLLYCGTVTEHYDLTLAVGAIARLVREIPVKLRILGEGNRLAEVFAVAASSGVAASIEHLGLVPIEQVPAEMRKADVGVSCHRAGVFGDLYFSTKIVEYLTQGLPVVSPRTTTITKYLPEECLFFFDAGSEEAMVDQLRFIWRNHAEVARRLEKSRALLPQLSWQAERSKFVAFYADLMGPARPAVAEPETHAVHGP